MVTVEVIDEIILILFSVTQLHEKLKNALQLEELKALQITGLALEQFPGAFPIHTGLFQELQFPNTNGLNPPVQLLGFQEMQLPPPMGFQPLQRAIFLAEQKPFGAVLFQEMHGPGLKD